MKEFAKMGVKKLFAPCRLNIKRIDETSCGYISARNTVSAANHAGLSVCDYIETLWNQKGDTQRVIDQMASCGAFRAKSPNILEIGTGTGRYLEKVLAQCKPNKYESYEPAQDWAKWLQSNYPIISHKADGASLRQTADHSVDLLHAHGVFTYLPFFVSYHYWKEIWRVMKDDSSVVFDIFSEDCLDESTVEKWILAGDSYPCFLSKDFVISRFREHGFFLYKTFTTRYGAGRSEYLFLVRNTLAKKV
jgi:hypothetical protein